MKDKLNVLVVDDEADILEVLKRGLSNHDIIVTELNDPELALSHYKPDYYDANSFRCTYAKNERF